MVFTKKLGEIELLEHLETFRNGFVVSCQPVDGGPLDRPEIVAQFALAALAGGATALRIEGIGNLIAVKKVTDAPIIGLVKSDRHDTKIRITSTLSDVEALAREGADIIAFDATDRTRPVSREALTTRIKDLGKLAMADCSCFQDGIWASQNNCDILGTTLSGYVGSSEPTEPDLDLVKALSGLGSFVAAEGRYNLPALAAQAIAAGADTVVVGSAITRPEHITSWFADRIQAAIVAKEGT